jgi:hypothetical protein
MTKGRRLPRPDFNENRVLGFPTRVLPSNVHLVNCIEQEAHGVFEVKCSCGRTSWTPWGEAHAEEVAQLHLWQMGVPVKGRVRQR